MHSIAQVLHRSAALTATPPGVIDTEQSGRRSRALLDENPAADGLMVGVVGGLPHPMRGGGRRRGGEGFDALRHSRPGVPARRFWTVGEGRQEHGTAE